MAAYKTLRRFCVRSYSQSPLFFNHLILSFHYFHFQLRFQIEAKKKKNVEIHRIAAELIRKIGGARIINCKSGKDRTGMAVTLEQARLMQQQIGIQYVRKMLLEKRHIFYFR